MALLERRSLDVTGHESLAGCYDRPACWRHTSVKYSLGVTLTEHGAQHGSLMGHRVTAFVGHTLECGHGSQKYGQSKDTPLIRMMCLLLPWFEALRENTIRFEPHVHSASSAMQTSSAHALRLSCAISAQVEIQIFPWRPRWNTCLHMQCIAQTIGLPHHRFAFAAKPSPQPNAASTRYLQAEQMTQNWSSHFLVSRHLLSPLFPFRKCSTEFPPALVESSMSFAPGHGV